MSNDQIIAFSILGAALALFAWGRWRYDLVAVLALIAVLVTGLLPAAAAFDGFAHPAVITVAAVLVISRALQNAGVVDAVMTAIAPLKGRENLQVGAQTGLIAVLSGLMNNVGALALMLPVALRNAYRDGYSPAKSLMPLAFGSLLGGLVTLIGTPPNIIISSYREQALGEPYAMFDFAPVGGAIAVAGVLFVVLAGWRLIPKDRLGAGDADELFDIGDYLLEAKAPRGSKAVGMTLSALENMVDANVQVVGVAHGEKKQLAPAGTQTVRAADVLILEGDPESLKSLIKKAGLQLAEGDKLGRKDVRSQDIEVVEAILKPGSALAGKSPAAMRLRSRYGVNLLGLARHGKRASGRVGDTRMQVGDVLLLQGEKDALAEAVAELGCVPLAERQIAIGRPQRLALSVLFFGAAIASVLTGLAPIQVAFVAAVAALVLAQVVRPDEVYASIDWPVIVLLGAMIPVGAALEAAGGTRLVADGILDMTRGLSPAWVILVLLVATMLLSDVINNNATAVLMAPIALTVAERLGARPDAFLMSVAIGASCAFLTPIGHQSNTLVWEPGGYQFGDYWRMGLPLELLIAAIAVPMLLVVWPL
jgi:di/tricarboxylate transporter